MCRIPLSIYNGYAIYATNSQLDYNAALYWYHQALRMAYEAEDRLNYCALLCNVSDIYYIKEDTSGLRYALEACRLAGSLGNEYLKYYSTLSAAKMYNVCGDYERSIKCLDSAVIYGSRSYYIDGLYAKNSMALGDTAMAESCFQRIFSHDTPFPSASVLESYLNFGRLLNASGRYSAAEYYITMGIAESEKVHNQRALMSFYEILSEIYEKEGRDSLSREYSDKASRIRNTVQTVENEREFGMLRLQYQDVVNQLDSQKKEFELRETRLTLVFSVVFFIVVLILVLLYFRKKRRTYKELVKRYEERRATVRRLEEDNARLKKQYNDVMARHQKTEQEIAAAAEKDKVRNETVFSHLEKLMSERQVWRNKDISLDLVAQMLGTNTKYVTKCLSDYAGTSFYAYINKFRINEAIRLLAVPGDDTPMKAIADMVGYSSLTSFYRVFQKETGVPPRYYREELRAGHTVSQ